MKATGKIWASSTSEFLLIRALGPWSKASLRRFTDSFSQNVDLNLSQPWGTLACLYGDSILTPEAINTFKKSHYWQMQNNMAALAINLANCEAIPIVKHQLQGIYREVGCNYCFVENDDSGIAWLQQQGINVDRSLLSLKPTKAFW